MEQTTVDKGAFILGDIFSPEVQKFLVDAPKFSLIVVDPPYSGIVKDDWDRLPKTSGPRKAQDFQAHFFLHLVKYLATILIPQGALYLWGGIGKFKHRPFYQFLSEVEHETLLEIANHITWSKKRAYGVQNNYLFTREELIYFVNGDAKKPRKFEIPLLAEKRPYAGYNKAYPAKSEHYRRTNVWSDITELLRGKSSTAQKPERVYEIPIEIHTHLGEWVLDPCSGSGTLARACHNTGRRFICVEKDPAEYEKGIRLYREHVAKAS